MFAAYYQALHAVIRVDMEKLDSTRALSAAVAAT
jgi:hypothetical protein